MTKEYKQGVGLFRQMRACAIYKTPYGMPEGIF